GRGVPSGPMVLRSGRFVLAMVLLGLSQKLCERRDVYAAEASSRKPCLDRLEEPAVAVGIAERRKRAVGATFGVGARQGWSPEAGEMERLSHVCAAADELRPCRLDVGHHEIQILDRARY